MLYVTHQKGSSVSSCYYHSRERLAAILRKHSGHHIDNDVELRLIGSCNINEDVASVESDFGMFRVDDGGHRKNSLLRVVDDWVDWRALDDMQITGKMFLVLATCDQCHAR